jgi:hypothetical protein
MMEDTMSKKANELLLELLASRIDAAGAHCPDTDTPPPEDEPDDEEPCEPDDDDKDKGGTKIRFL